MLPSDVSPELQGQAQQILKTYNDLYPSEFNRKLYPEMIQAVQFCISWSFTVEEIKEAIHKSKTHPFWSDAMSQGALTGFLKPRHIETVRHYQPEVLDLARRQHELDRWEEKDAKRNERQKRKGFDSDGNPILRVAVQR